jgi:hypothetical protein
MLKSDSSRSQGNTRTTTAHLPLLWVLAAFLTFLPSAFGQDFNLSAQPFYPSAVDPGGTSFSNISVGIVGNNFSGTVSLACQVSPPSDPATGLVAPTCNVSPTTVTPAGGATATIITNATSTQAAATAGLYTMTITGTGPSTQHTTPELSLTVLAVEPQFTITVASVISPTSVPAGSTGTGTINVNPLAGYTGSVTLSCSTITPLVTIPPICQFNPPTVTVPGPPSTLSIVTQGPTVPITAVAHSRSFYALWLPLPMLALMGLGAASSKKGVRKVWGLLALLVVAGSLMLLPACANNSNTTKTKNPNGATPNNTYTFTVRGIDAQGNTASNTSGGATPSVTLTVTTATTP